MKQHLYGDELVLSILEKELTVLKKKAEKAKAECEEAMSAASKICSLRAEAHELIKDGMRDLTKQKLAKLDELAANEKRLLAIAKQGLSKFMDAESYAEIAVHNLVEVIAGLKWRVKRQKGTAA